MNCFPLIVCFKSGSVRATKSLWVHPQVSSLSVIALDRLLELYWVGFFGEEGETTKAAICKTVPNTIKATHFFDRWNIFTFSLFNLLNSSLIYSINSSLTDISLSSPQLLLVRSVLFIS